MPPVTRLGSVYPSGRLASTIFDCFLQHLHPVAQGLAPSRCSINIGWLNSLWDMLPSSSTCRSVLRTPEFQVIISAVRQTCKTPNNLLSSSLPVSYLIKWNISLEDLPEQILAFLFSAPSLGLHISVIRAKNTKRKASSECGIRLLG